MLKALLLIPLAALLFASFNTPPKAGDIGINSIPPVKLAGTFIVPRTTGNVIGSSTVDIAFRTATGTTICIGADCRTSWPTGVTDHGALTGLGDDDHTQYHNDSRALTWLGTRSTSDISEGSNLYYTDTRAKAVWNQDLYSTSSPTFASGTIGPFVVRDTLSESTSNYLTLTGTLPSTASGAHYGFRGDITTAGTSSQIQAGLLMNLLAGYTGSARTIGLQFANAVAGTGTEYNSSGLTVPNGNSGFAGQANASTTGYNYGGSGYANGGAVNVGVIGRALTNNVGANVGIVGTAGGTSPASRTGGFFGTIPSGTEPVLENAGLIADNGSFAAPIFLARDNQSTVFTIADGGNVGVGTTPTEIFHVKRDINSDTTGVIENTATGTLTYAALEIRNGTSVSDGFRAGVLGTGYSSSGGYIQDAAFFGSEANISNGLSIITRNASAPIRFYTGGFADANERLRITQAGLVGIGTSTPANILHIVNGTATTSVAIGSSAIGTNRGQNCQWNGASYTITSFAANSITPSYATSTTCQ